MISTYFAFKKNEIIRHINGKLVKTFNMVDISALAFYVGFKVTCDCK